MSLSTFVFVVVLLVVLVLYGVFRLFRWCFRSVREALRDLHEMRKEHRAERKAEKKRLKAEARAAEEHRRAEEETQRRIALIDHTSIVERRKVFDSNRKYHYETTFMVFRKNGTRSAVTVEDGLRTFDILMSLTEGDVSFRTVSPHAREEEHESSPSFVNDVSGAFATSHPIVSLECVYCGGTLDVDPDDPTRARCPHCNRQYLVPANEAVRLQQIRSDTHKEIEMKRQETDDTVARMDATGREKERERSFQKWIIDVFLARSGLCVGLVFSVIALIFDSLRPLLFFGLVFMFVDLIIHGIRSIFRK